jgi:hypothetical protein
MGRNPPSRDDPPKRTVRAPPGPIPTLASLRRSTCWLWLYCKVCPHHAPQALAPVIIGWGPETSSNVLRQRAHCTRCGARGATLMHPTWGGEDVGLSPFPADRLARWDRADLTLGRSLTDSQHDEGITPVDRFPH